MNPQIEFESLLKQHRFRLVSQNKHYKYGTPDGRILVVPKTPSDWRAWRNMVSTLKSVVSSPVPSSSVIEEERQRRILEARIQIASQAKKNGGRQGAVKSKGCGIYYDDVKPVAFVPEEVREAQRNDDRWDSLIRHVRKERRQVEAEFAHCYEFAFTIAVAVTARRILAEGMHEIRRTGDERQKTQIRDRQNRFHAYSGLVTTLKKAKLEEAGEKLFEVFMDAQVDAQRDPTGTIEVDAHGAPENLHPDVQKMTEGSIWFTYALWGRSKPAATWVREMLTSRAHLVLDANQFDKQTRRVLRNFLGGACEVGFAEFVPVVKEFLGENK